MTSEKNPATENDALEKKIAALEKEMVTLKVVIRRAGRTRLALLLAVLLIIGGAIWSFYRLAKDFASKENMKALADKASVRAEDTKTELLKHAMVLKDTSLPVLQKAFEDQVNKDRDKYTDLLNKEGQTLSQNVQAELEKKLRAHFEEQSSRYQAILQEEFPDLKDPELSDKMYSAVTDVLDRLVNEYYSAQIQDQIQQMNDQWREFEMAEMPKQDEPNLEMQFVASLFYLAAMKIDKRLAE